MTNPPGQDRYSIAGIPFQGKAFSEALLRELYAGGSINADTLIAPENTTAWKKLAQAFPAWAASPPPPLPLIPPAGSQATPENPYGCVSTVMLFIAIGLGLASVASGQGLFLPLAAMAAGFVALSYILSILGQIVIRQKETMTKVDRLLTLLEPKQPAPANGDSSEPEKENE